MVFSGVLGFLGYLGVLGCLGIRGVLGFLGSLDFLGFVGLLLFYFLLFVWILVVFSLISHHLSSTLFRDQRLTVRSLLQFSFKLNPRSPLTFAFLAHNCNLRGAVL